ncbi:aldehyde dehydrogenase family protein, partial [Amycolatopsis mediterranei]
MYALNAPSSHYRSGKGRMFDVLNPATGEVILTVAEASSAEVDAAVTAARRA